MLKTQLHSKIFQLTSDWRSIEDILTGDFFGTLDYLSRKPFLESFIYQMQELNPSVSFPNLSSVDWDHINLEFWPMKITDNASAEPDLVILSNEWVIIVEVKLDSGLGDKQLWREYYVGQSIAVENNIPQENVYCLLLTINQMNESEVFHGLTKEQRAILSPKVMYLLWHEAAAIVESWSRYGVFDAPLKREHHRMITDLLFALRKRKNLLFSGFRFHNMEQTQTFQDRIFSPELFHGFLNNTHPVDMLDYSLVTDKFSGFMQNTLIVSLIDYASFKKHFDGFCNNSKKCKTFTGYWNSFQFNGFQNSVAKCNRSNMTFFKGLNNEINR